MMKDFMNIIHNCDLAFYNYRFNFLILICDKIKKSDFIKTNKMA